MSTNMNKIIDYITNLKPKTENEIIEEIKEFVETEEFDLKTLKKKIFEFSQPYNYKLICEEILNKFGIVYKPADVKKLTSVVSLIPQ